MDTKPTRPSAPPAQPAVTTVRQFSQANPEGAEQGNLPALLRRVARTIEALGPIDVQDVVMGTEVTDRGPWYYVTVYFQPLGEQASAGS